MGTFLFWLSFLLSAATPLQDAAKRNNLPAEPSVDQILDNYEAAIGGKQAWAGLTSRVSRGTIKALESGLSGTLDVYELGPSKLYLVERLSNGVEVKIGFDGTVGWTINPQSGTRRFRGEELADLKRRAQFPEEIKFREMFNQVHLKGKIRLDGRDTYVIEGVPVDGGPWTLYFDAKTWLRVRTDGTVHFAQLSEAGQSYFDDYREVGDSRLKYPFRTTMKTPHGTLVRRVEEVQLNVPVDQSVFNPPSFKFKIQQ
jgi:hypothetical protein